MHVLIEIPAAEALAFTREVLTRGLPDNPEELHWLRLVCEAPYLRLMLYDECFNIDPAAVPNRTAFFGIAALLLQDAGGDTEEPTVISGLEWQPLLSQFVLEMSRIWEPESFELHAQVAALTMAMRFCSIGDVGEIFGAWDILSWSVRAVEALLSYVEPYFRRFGCDVQDIWLSQFVASPLLLGESAVIARAIDAFGIREDFIDWLLEEGVPQLDAPCFLEMITSLVGAGIDGKRIAGAVELWMGDDGVEFLVSWAASRAPDRRGTFMEFARRFMIRRNPGLERELFDLAVETALAPVVAYARANALYCAMNIVLEAAERDLAEELGSTIAEQSELLEMIDNEPELLELKEQLLARLPVLE